jgi:ACS family hexuronate transporter-like MFS transporter
MLRLLLGFSEAGNWPAGAKAITEWFPQQRRAFAMGVFDAGSAVGAVLAPPLVAALAMACGWRATFVAVAVLGLAWVPAWGWIYGSPNERPTAAQNLKDSATPSSWLRCAVGSRQIWGLLTMRMFATPVWWFYVLWLPDYLSQVRQFSLKEIGLFGWIPYLVADIGKLAGGHWSDWLLRRGASANLARKSVMLAGALMMVAGVMVIGAGSGAVALAWVSVATFGFGVWSPNVYAIHGDIFPSAMMARAIGTTGLGASLGGAFFSFLTGVLVQWYGYPSAFLIAGLSAPVACLALFFWVGRVEPIRTQPSSALAIRTSSSG